VGKRKAVFNLGETGKKFYIILKGSVYILLKKTGLEPSVEDQMRMSTKLKELASEELYSKNELRKKMRKEENVEREVLEEIHGWSDETFIEVKYPNFLVMRTLKNGDSFGEVALRQNVARFVNFLFNIL
jgi:CRP-like cAMP-binding protein